MAPAPEAMATLIQSAEVPFRTLQFPLTDISTGERFSSLRSVHLVAYIFCDNLDLFSCQRMCIHQCVHRWEYVGGSGGVESSE